MAIVENASAVAEDNKALVDEIASQEVVIEELTEKLKELGKYVSDKDIELLEIKERADKLTAELAKIESELAEYKGGSKVAEPVKEVKK